MYFDTRRDHVEGSITFYCTWYIILMIYDVFRLTCGPLTQISPFSKRFKVFPDWTSTIFVFVLGTGAYVTFKLGIIM